MNLKCFFCTNGCVCTFLNRYCVYIKIQSISKTPFQHCVCLPSLPHQASLPGLAPGQADVQEIWETVAPHVSKPRSSSNHLTWTQSYFTMTLYPYRTILWIYDMNFKCLKSRSSHDLYNFCQQMIVREVHTAQVVSTWSYIIYYLHMCLVTTSDHPVIETF